MNVRIIPVTLGFDRCYLLQSRGLILVDAGVPGKVRKFSRVLEKAGIRPVDVKLIVATHGHWDHIGSAKDIQDLTGARIAMHGREAPWLEGSLKPLPPGVTAWGRILMRTLSVFMPLVNIPPAAVDFRIGDDGLSLHEYGIPGEVIHTPGHTSGSVSVLLESGEAFVGDLAMNAFPLSLGPGLPIFAENLPEAKRSLRELLRRGARTIHPAHGRPFPAHIIKKALAGR